MLTWKLLIKISFKSSRGQWVKVSTAKCQPFCSNNNVVTNWGRVMHICVSKLTIIGSDNGLSPSRRQAIIWTNAGILLFRPLATNFSEIWIKIYVFSFTKMHLKMSSGKWRPFCLSLNVLRLSVDSIVMPKAVTSLVQIMSVPSHYLNKCWNIVNSTLRNKLQWNINRNWCIFIQENAFENVVWKMAAILSQPQCVKTLCR